jgi:hypothetical protein
MDLRREAAPSNEAAAQPLEHHRRDRICLDRKSAAPRRAAPPRLPVPPSRLLKRLSFGYGTLEQMLNVSRP